MAFEAGLRITGFGAVTPQMNFGMHAKIALDRGVFLPDPVLFWKVKPDLNPEFERRARIQHPDRPVPPRTQRSRVLIIGDSCSRIAGEGMPYSVFLEERLGSDRWEVLNASVPGYTSFQGMRWLQSQLLDAHPDLVVVYFGWNEHWRTTGMTDRAYARTRAPAYPRILTLFHPHPRIPPLRVSVSEYRENLETIVRLVDARGGRVVLVAGPYRFAPGVEAQYVKDKYLVEEDDVVSLHRAYLDVVRGFRERTEVGVLEADSVFDAMGDSAQLLRQDGIHFTDHGHRAMAAILAAFIQSTPPPEDSLLVDAARRAIAQ